MTSRQHQLPNPWWQGGNDDDLKNNPYAAEDEYHEDIISTSSSIYIEEDSEESPMSQSMYGSDPIRTGRSGQTDPRDRYRSTTNNNESDRYPSQQDRKWSDEKRSSDFQRPKEDSGSSKPSFGSANGSSGKERERFSSYSDKSKSSSQSLPPPVARPPTASRSSSRESKLSSTSSSPRRKTNIGDKKKIKWTCRACTYENVREFTITAEPKIRAVCDMCNTPCLVRVRPKEDFEEIDLDGRLNSKSRLSSGTKSTARSSYATDTSNNKVQKPGMASRNTSTGANTDVTGANTESSSSTESSSNRNGGKASYSMSELINSLGTNENSVDLPPSLTKRVQDFRFAQNKRREKHGDQKPWGIYGLYAHLSDIRADLEWAEDAAWRRHRGEPYLSWKDFDNSRDKGLHNRPIFTYAVLAMCTLMMFVTFGVNGWKFEPLNINPLIGPSSETLIKCGARDTNLIVNEGQWYRLFTPMILHAGLVHYFVNMLALYFIGGAVEKTHGFASAAVFFVIPAVGGNILSAICLPGFISVGASGGIFGLIGGCMADICLNWNLLFLKTTTDEKSRWRHFYVLLWLALDVIINLLLGFTPFVDNFTHLGGFLYGFFIGFASIERLASTFFGIRATDESKWSRLMGMVLRFFGLIVSVIAIMVTTIVLTQSDGLTSPCNGCRYISCVPFPPKVEDKWWYCDDCGVVTADIFQSVDGTGLYEQVDMNCPNGEVEKIPIDDLQIYDREELRRMLPSMCRDYCDEVFGRR